MTKKQNELLEKVQELEERTTLLRGMILGVYDRINAMENAFAGCVAELRDLVAQVNIKTTAPLRKKSPKASPGGSSARSSKRGSKRQSTPRAGSSRSSRKKG